MGNEITQSYRLNIGSAKEEQIPIKRTSTKKTPKKNITSQNLKLFQYFAISLSFKQNIKKNLDYLMVMHLNTYNSLE